MKHLILVSAFALSAAAFAKGGDNDRMWLCTAKGSMTDGQKTSFKGEPRFYKRDAQRSALEKCTTAGYDTCKVKHCVMRAY